MKSNEKIAFFDSGVGGLTVFNKFKQILPNEDCIYFGDSKNIPYGDKSKEELLVLADKVFKFLEGKGVKAVVMACNTTSANVYDELKNNYGFRMYPIIQSAANIISSLGCSKIGVFATNATISSHAYSRELLKYNSNVEVFEMACPPWVKIVEDNTQNLPESDAVIKEYLEKMLDNKPEKIILGCTHYPYLLDVLSEFAPREMFIDPASYFVEFIKTDLQKENLLNKQQHAGSDKFYVTAGPENFAKSAKMFCEIKDLPELVLL